MRIEYSVVTTLDTRYLRSIDTRTNDSLVPDFPLNWRGTGRVQFSCRLQSCGLCCYCFCTEYVLQVLRGTVRTSIDSRSKGVDRAYRLSLSPIVLYLPLVPSPPGLTWAVRGLVSVPIYLPTYLCTLNNHAHSTSGARYTYSFTRTATHLTIANVSSISQSKSKPRTLMLR